MSLCFFRYVFIHNLLQANLAVQENRLTAATNELNTAQAQLDDKQRELDKVQAVYDAAMTEKQVSRQWLFLLCGSVTVDAPDSSSSTAILKQGDHSSLKHSSSSIKPKRN